MTISHPSRRFPRLGMIALACACTSAAFAADGTDAQVLESIDNAAGGSKFREISRKGSRLLERARGERGVA